MTLATPPVLDVAIIGAGPHGLTLATHLLKKKPQVPLLQQFQALDPLPWVGGLPVVDRGYSGES